MRGQPDLGAVGAEDHRVEAVRDACGVPGDRVEHALEVGWRGGDRAQDLRGGRLLLPGLPERPLRRRGLPGRARVICAEQEDGAAGERQAEGEQQDDARGPARRPAALREQGQRERAAGQPHAQGEASPETGSGQSGGRRHAPPGGPGTVGLPGPLSDHSLPRSGRRRSSARGPQRLSRSRHYSAARTPCGAGPAPARARESALTASRRAPIVLPTMRQERSGEELVGGALVGVALVAPFRPGGTRTRVATTEPSESRRVRAEVSGRVPRAPGSFVC